MVIVAPFDAMIAVFGFPVALATVYDVVRWRRKGPMRRLKRYLTKGSIIAASDSWMAFAIENAHGWGVSEDGIDAINRTMEIINSFLPKEITSALPHYFLLLIVFSLIIYFVLYS